MPLTVIRFRDDREGPCLGCELFGHARDFLFRKFPSSAANNSERCGDCWLRVLDSPYCTRVVSRGLDGVRCPRMVPAFELSRMRGDHALPAAQEIEGRRRFAIVTRSVHSYVYDFTTVVSGCPAGANAYAGRNTNRSRLVDNGITVLSYCYDVADREIAASGIVYDSHQNRRCTTVTLKPACSVGDLAS